MSASAPHHDYWDTIQTSRRQRKLIGDEPVPLDPSLAIERPSRSGALIGCALTTLIWASSLVLSKMALAHMGPPTLAGLRYFLASLLLFPFMIRNGIDTGPQSPCVWLRLVVIGLCSYAIGNGALLWSLNYLSATTSSLILSLLPLTVLLADAAWLKELPTRPQVAGTGIMLSGSVLFFMPGAHSANPVGLSLAMVGLVGLLSLSFLGRAVARDSAADTLTLTAIPLAIGGVVTLTVAFVIEGPPQLPPVGWGLVLWLAVINTAFGYLLYNHALKVLTVLEMNAVLNLKPAGTALMSWLFLNEALGMMQVVGMSIVLVGAAATQRGGRT